MIQRSLFSHPGRWLISLLFVALLAVLLTACSLETPTLTPTDIPTRVSPTVARPTDTPTVARPTDTPTPTPAPPDAVTPLALPPILLPDEAIAQAKQIADSKGLKLNGAWAPERTTVYAEPGRGAIYLLNVFIIPDALRSVDLALSGALDNQAMGVLYVTPAAAGLPPDYLAPGVYVLALGSNGNLLNFFDQEANKREALADLRTFKSDRVMARPFALISREQMCLAWDALQVCGRQRTPLPAEFQATLERAAVLGLGLSPELFAIERGMFDIEGVNNLERCAQAVAEGKFEACEPSILVAPINKNGLNEPPPPEYDPLLSGKAPLAAPARAPLAQTPQAGLIGVAVVFSETIEEVYRDVQLTTPAPSLPADAYLMYDILLASDPQVGTNDGQPITLSRVELRLSPAVKYYLPDVRNVPLLGAPVNSEPPADQESEVAAVNLLVRVFGRQICLFRARECPGLRNN